ncbi:MAG: MbcA/ParS/Xre antitoxin family protein [Pseudomonadota bacterium]
MMAIPNPTSRELEALAGPALRTFFNIQSVWEISNDAAMTLLGLTSRSTFFKWKKTPDKARLSKDTVERLSYVFGIYKAINILLPEPAAADAWLKKPNDAAVFGGQSALSRMLSGQVADLYVVRQYLDAERGW